MKIICNTFISLTCLLLLMINSAFASHPPVCPPKSDVIKAASTYIDALVSHIPDNIPLDDKVVRWENAVNTANGANDLRHQLKTDRFYHTIKTVRDLRWYVDCDKAIAFYIIDVVFPHTHLTAGTGHITERFHVSKGKIKEIESIYCFSAGLKPEDAHVDPSKHHHRVSPVCRRSMI